MYGETDFIQELLASAWPDWKLASRLGKGSYGSVYEIYRDDLGTRYTGALKVLYMESGNPENSTIPDVSFPFFPDSTGSGGSSASGSSSASPLLQYASDSMVEDFIVSVSAEIKTMIDLKGHPHIVSIEDYAVRQGKGFCAILIRMEKLEALNAYIKRTGNISRSEVIRLGSEICDALSLCEKKNIIHRDIKLGNLFFSEKTGYKLGDFGISRTMASIYEKASMSGSGTPQYMAPEVYRGEKYNNTADLYSLGMVLYILMNDFAPPLCREYSNSTDRMSIIHQANMRRMQGEPLPKPSLADDRLAAVILRACSPNPEQRFPTADAFKKALQQCTISASAQDNTGSRMQSRIVRNFPTEAIPTDRPRSQDGMDPSAPYSQPARIPSGYGQGPYSQPAWIPSGYGQSPYSQSGERSYAQSSMNPSGYGDNPYARPAAGPSVYGDYTDPGTSSGTGRGGQKRSPLSLLPIIGVLCFAALVIVLVAVARLAGGKDSSHETADTSPADSQVVSSGGAADGSQEETPEKAEIEAVTPERETDSSEAEADNSQTEAERHAAEADSPAAEADTPVTVTRSMTDPIEWSDNTLRDAVYNYLNFDGTMTYKDASAVKELDLTGAGITDISSLENFTRIEVLDLAENSVEDLSPLSNLQSLTSLHLENNQISDLSPISKLTGLEHLDLCGNYLTDISDLEDLKSLKMLDIRENSISDISVLEDKVLMTDLYMGSNKISDISCLAGMTRLNYLNISYNQIEDISVVENMTDLRVLTMTSNKIKDISCLRSCPKIYHLKMKNNLVTDFSVLDTLKSLDHIEHD